MCIHEYTVFSRVFSHGSNTCIIRVNTYIPDTYRAIEIADEEVVLEGTPLVPLGPSLWYVHETQRRGSVHTHGQLYVRHSRMPRSFLTVHDPWDWPEVD